MLYKRRRPKCVALTVVCLPSSKRIKRINPCIKLKTAKKDKIVLQCAVSTSTAKHILKGVLVTKGKLKFDVNSIPDLIRDKKYQDTVIIYIFSSSLGRYCEDSAWAECLKL